MNTYPKSLRGFQTYKESYLTSLEPTLFNYFNSLVDNSLFITLTNYNGKIYKELDQYDFASFNYIFLLDILDPPHYHDTVGKWDDMKHRFKDHLNKTFVVSSLYKNPYFRTIPFDNFLHYVPEFFKEVVFTRNFTKKYLSYNGRPHLHRQTLLTALHENNLIKDGFVSGRVEGLLSLNLDDGISQKDYLHYNNQITTNHYYYSTPVNIVTETSISNECVFVSEKTVKAILAKQLIMHIGNPRSYQYLTKVYGLKNYGFDFEPKIADHSFEDKIKYYCSFLKETTLDDLTAIYKEKEDILEYNKNRVLNHFKDISYNLFLTSLKKYNIIPT
jgi:hypothetical protein